MPTPISKGNTSFREKSVELTLNRSGLDSLTVVLRGATSALTTALGQWPIGASYSGYPNMRLESRSSSDSGPVTDLTLNFVGIVGHASSKVFTDKSNSRQTVSITTDADENVNFTYFAESNSTKWFHVSSKPPTGPNYKPTGARSEIPVNELLLADPPDFEGSINDRYRPVLILTSFSSSLVAEGIYEVTETWEQLIEPISVGGGE